MRGTFPLAARGSREQPQRLLESIGRICCNLAEFGNAATYLVTYPRTGSATAALAATAAAVSERPIQFMPFISFREVTMARLKPNDWKENGA